MHAPSKLILRATPATDIQFAPGLEENEKVEEGYLHRFQWAGNIVHMAFKMYPQKQSKQ
jgi:hypothetical protein